MQAVIHEMSSAVPLPKFDLFGVPPTQAMIERDIVTEHRPLTTIDPNSFIQFEIQTGIDEYIDLEKLYLSLKLRVKALHSDDPTKIADWKDVSQTNYLLHSLIKQMDIFIGDKQISSSSPTYSYKAYLEALLGFGLDAKASHLTSALWYNDECMKIDGPIKDVNAPIKDFKPVDLYGRLHTDLSFQGRSLLGGTKLTIRLLLNDVKFAFNANGCTPEIEYLDAALHVHRAKVPMSIVEAHNSALKMATAKYPITLSKVKTFTIAKGSNDANIDNIHSGQLPRRIFICFVDNRAFNGDLKLNPFKFQHFEINNLAVYLDGIQYPAKAYTPDFKRGLFQREMISLFDALDMMDGDSNFKINRENYASGNTIFGFNFAPDLSSGCGSIGHLNPIKFGSVRLSVKFSEPLKVPVTALVYCEFDKLLEIDINRNATLDLF